MSQQPVHVGVGIDLSAGNILTAFYATVSTSAASIAILATKGVISDNAALVVSVALTIAAAFLGKLLGTNTAPNQFADERDQLRAENDALKAQATSAAPEPPAHVLPTAIHFTYPDGTVHEVTVTP